MLGFTRQSEILDYHIRICLVLAMLAYNHIKKIESAISGVFAQLTLMAQEL